jgi:hypothetical protein
MKHVSRLLSLIILVSAGLFYVSCDGSDDGDKSQEELQLDKLKSTWTLQSANDGTDRTGDYEDMTVTISGTFSEGGTYNYTSDATNWPSVSPWKAIDTWKFKSGSVTSAIVRQSDLQEMNYSLSNGDKTLTISFNYQGPGFNNGRTQSVTGDWDFVFTRP